MLRNGRTGNHPETSFSTTIAAFTIIAAAGLAGCSADVMRFDAPALGYNGAGSERRTAEADPGQTLFDQTPPASGGSGGGFEPRRTETGSVTRSELPRVAQPAEPSRSAPRTPPAARTPANTYPLEPDQPRRTAFNAPRRAAPRSSVETPQTVVVQRGDTLYRISRTYNVSIADIKSANGLTSNVIKPGQRLVLRNGGETPPTRARYALEPDRSAAPRTPVAPVTAAPAIEPSVTPPPATASGAATGATYVMRRGDSLYGIARSNGLKVATLMQLNGITDPRHVRAGTVLRLGPGSAPATAPRQPVSAPTRTASAGRYATPGTAPAQPTIINGRNAPPTRRVKSVSVPVTQPQTPPSPPSAPTAQAGTRAPATLGGGKFRWPVRGRIVKNFGSRGDGTKNDGVDIAVPFGTAIHAAESGVVAYAGDELKGYGNLVLIRHDNGFVTAYAHNDQLLVKRGDTVRRGQVIAKAGKTGNVKQPMLHFELRQGAKPVNPLPHLAQL